MKSANFLMKNLDPKLHKQIKIAAVMKGVSMKEYILSAVQKQLLIDSKDD